MYIGKILQIDSILYKVVQLRDLSGRTIPREEPLQPYVTYDFSLEPLLLQGDDKPEKP